MGRGRRIFQAMPRHLLAILLAGVSCLFGACATPPGPRTLEQKLDTACSGFPGRVGYYVRHLATGERAERNADDLFPTASMIKVPILVTVFERIEAGALSYDQKLRYESSRRYPGADLLGKFQGGEEISLQQLILLMETLSDNTASLWLQELCGTGTHINAVLARLGFSRIRMNSQTPGRRFDWEHYGWGQCSPREMAELLVRIRAGELGSAWASERMRRALARSYWDDVALSQLPPRIEVLSKQGAVSDSRSEVILVHAPGGDFVACFVTDGQRDRSWRDDNEGFELLRRLTRICWRHFEPDSEYVPPLRTPSQSVP